MGRPLDDVVVHAHDATGHHATLEIQVKREITFAPTDPVFRKVVGQIVKASRRDDFLTTRYELAIATAKGSRKIDGAYQAVLMLARQIGDAATFISQIGLAGAANDDMRAFVRTFRSHLRDEGSPDDDTTTWKLLGRVQILVFDFTATGSACEELAHERAAHVLHANDVSKAGALWKNLVELALDIAKGGGDRTRDTLLASLASLAFRFAGERRHTKARAALAEGSQQALADIRNCVGKVVLTRQERVSALNGALDHGRYVEIRGDAGVGKSGVLRHLAEQLTIEGQVVVLSPRRCVPRGWHAMRAQIGFDGDARELLVELANDGGAILFVDNLDVFSDEERLTVIDLVRAASTVQGVSVVATARHGFGIDEPSWLPTEALDRLERANPIEIGELSKAEIEQLKAGDPALTPLLADEHPARKVTRNLFRLNRLATQPASEALPRTEIDMAEQWWKTADGAIGEGWRDRTRLLQDAAEQTMQRADTLDVTGRLSEPIDALVASGTLRDLGSDRVAFRHDVFGEWAVANALHADASWIDRLPLERPAPAPLARGIELAARMALERATDGKPWDALVQRLSRTGAHQSWRRSALLALARSEAGIALLSRASSELQADGATLLRELIRTVIAVEVIPASSVFVATGVDPALIPASLNVPRGPGWLELIAWLLALGKNVPAQAIPEIVDLYASFSIGTLGATAITPLTTRALYGWLRQMEPRSTMPLLDESPLFWHGLEHEQVQSLKFDLRSGFLMFCRQTPDLAAEYLRAVMRSEHNDDLVRSILKMRGTLAQAAPAELAELTAQALIENPKPRHGYRGSELERSFTFLDSEFLPASPAQGPFFDLLVASPKDGLALVHRLVDHAVADGCRGRAPGENIINVTLADGDRAFTWPQTYFWSRTSNFYGVTSGLMALEAWAHRRVEAGETFETVLTDVMGPIGSPAAYLLVAVDLIISHWPKSAGIAAGFLGCPALLCVDHTRQVHDLVEQPAFFGFGAMRAEPRGAVSAAELKGRPSRQNTLDGLIGNYALLVSQEQREELVELLKAAAARLGPPSTEATLGDPEFMVTYALNLAEPANWQEVTVTLKDGSTRTARQYVSPQAEQQHLQALRDAAAGRNDDFAMQSSIGLATENPSYLSPEARSAAITWARGATDRAAPDEDSEDSHSAERMQKEAILTAAMIVMRDGDARQRAEHEAWALDQFARVLQAEDDDLGHQVRSGLRFNPTAIAYAGVIHALKHRSSREDVRALLAIAAQDNPSAAHGYGASAAVLDAIDGRLPLALLRCALSACVQPNRVWDLPEDELTARAERRRQRATTAVEAEIAWLYDDGLEPDWPPFPQDRIRRKRRLRLPGGAKDDDVATPVESEPTEYVNHQAAARWLRQTRDLLDVAVRPWLRALAWAYMPWTIAANGAGHDASDDVDQPPMEWNDAFFDLVARCSAGLSVEELTRLVVTPITSLPDRHFFDVLADFQRSFDATYFGGGDVPTPIAVHIRMALAKRLEGSRGWERLIGAKEMSIEMHLGPAVAVIFFNDYLFEQGTKCYLFAQGVERVKPFLPLLERLVKSAPSPFVALVLLNLLEVAPRPEHLALLVTAGKAWLATYPDFRPFWIDHGIGRRLCLVVESIRAQVPRAFADGQPIRADLDGVLAALIGLGVAEASRLEAAIGKEGGG